jgi:HEPN domain-containing protein
MNKKANKLFKAAKEKLSEANEELFRPKEDVVSYLVCKNSQYAIENYLRGYLYDNGIDSSKFKTIEDLYQQCKLINKKFENVDLSDFKCKSYNADTRKRRLLLIKIYKILSGFLINIYHPFYLGHIFFYSHFNTGLKCHLIDTATNTSSFQFHSYKFIIFN